MPTCLTYILLLLGLGFVSSIMLLVTSLQLRDLRRATEEVRHPKG